MPFLAATSVDKSYQVGTTRLQVLRDLSLSVERGEMVAIVGASGVGKSTLLHVLGGLDSIDGGSVQIAGDDLQTMRAEQLVAFRNRHVGFVFQFHHLLPEFTALENAEMPMRIARMALAEGDTGEQLGRSTTGLVQRHPGDTHRHLDVLGRVELRQQMVKLEDEAHVPVPELDQRQV